MRQCLVTIVLIGIAVGCRQVHAEPQPAQAQHEQPPAPAANGAVDDTLALLQQAGQNLKDFTAEVSMAELDAMTGAPKTRTGTVWYTRSDDGAVRMRLTLDKLIDDRGAVNRKIEYLLKDGWLTDRDYTSKVEVARQILRPGEKIDLLKLGEGPFPLPIGQDPAEVKKQFEVKPLPTEQDVPQEELERVKNTTRLQLVPREGSQLKDDFASIDVWVDIESRFPRRVMTTSETTVQITDLSNLRVNAGIADDRFTLQDISKDNWNLRSEPFER